MTVLVMVRHGETPWTVERRLQGRTDVDLSAVGRDSVARLRGQVEAWHPRAVIVSPLARARSTAALLSDLEPVIDERWAEAGLGQWEGRSADTLGPDYARWRAGAHVPQGGEPPAAVLARTCAAARDAAAQQGPVLIVTHGGVIRAVLAGLLGLTADRIEAVAAPSITVLDVSTDPHAVARLLRFNLQV